MAYRSLNNHAYADLATFFCDVRDFIASLNGTNEDYSASGLGWTVHDSSYATDADNPAYNDWIVFKSTGTSGNEDLYIRFRWSAAAQFRIEGWLYWNNSTHAGVQSYYYVYNYHSEPTSSKVTVGGDEDSFFISVDNDGTAGLFTGGIITDSQYDITVVTVAAAIAAGSSVTVTVSSVPSSWAVGKSVVIRNNAGIERATISAISGTSVTFTTIANSYAAGTAKLSQECGYCAYETQNTVISVLIGHEGTVPASASSMSTQTFVKSPIDDSYLLQKSLASSSLASLGVLKNIIRVSSLPSGVSNDDLIGSSGDYWRARNYYSTSNFLIREV